MTMEDVREYESRLQKETNNLLIKNMSTSEDTNKSLLGSGDNPPSLGNSQPGTPRSPKSPSKKGYFSNWF